MGLIENIRPDRQIVMFTSTFSRNAENFSKKVLKSLMEITVGVRGVVRDGMMIVATEIEAGDPNTSASDFNRHTYILFRCGSVR